MLQNKVHMYIAVLIKIHSACTGLIKAQIHVTNQIHTAVFQAQLFSW